MHNRTSVAEISNGGIGEIVMILLDVIEAAATSRTSFKVAPIEERRCVMKSIAGLGVHLSGASAWLPLLHFSDRLAEIF